MFTPDQKRALEATADRVIPEDASAPPASRTGVILFFEDLFSRERAAELPALLAFLGRIGTNADPAADPYFRAFAEMVHEHYWTCPEGLAAVGFAITDP